MNKQEHLATRIFWASKNNEWVDSLSTASMEPLIKGGSQVKFVSLTGNIESFYKLGDVVVFFNNDKEGFQRVVDGIGLPIVLLIISSIRER